MSKTVTAPAEKRRCRPSAARVSGAKGGESTPYTPYKAPDTALSVATVKLLYALSEGPIVGPVSGNSSVKLNGTPLLSPDGSENFPGTIWDFRAGTVDQEHIAGFPAIENEASQGLPVELKSDNAWTRAITDQQLSAVRIRLSWPQIWEVRANGDQVGYRIDYAIDLSVNGGSYQTVLSATLNDKGTTEYERSHRIDLPEGFTSALVRVRRLTPNRNDNNFADLVRIKGLTEVIDKKLRYPNLALGGLQFDAKQFQDTPKFSALMRGRIVQVPTNYDPQTRTYTGDWNGIFKLAYTNNPVWIWRDLLLHRRYGLGRRITADMVDHWTLYEIGRYCDVMVPDGKGGLQPRMTTNVYIQDSIEGYALLSDLASVFRGSSCWNGSQVTMVADIPGNEDGYVFTRSNIIGEFEYVAAAFPDRHTRAKVAWDNPENEFKTQPAPVTNEEMIGALGHRMLDISRFGCTVEGEAIRHGIWALKSEQYEEWSVSFTTGMEGRNVEPGQIICVADELFSGRPNGGRISAATKRVITLDIDAEVHQEDRLIINLPSGKSEGRIVKSVSGRLVTVMADYSELPEPECSWSVESADLAVMRFRVQTIEPQGLHQFKIAATQHEPLKYPAIDTGARIDPQPTSIIPPGVMTPPKGITLEARSVVSQGIAVTSMRIAWESVPGAIAYNVEWRKDSGNWVRLPRTGSLGAEVEGIYSGRYVARVSSINAMDVASIWSTSSEVVLTGKTGLPPAVSFLSTTSELFGISIKWGFPPGAEDTQRTEVWYGAANSLPAATKLADLAYPQADYRMQQLKAGATLFFWARLVDRTGNLGPFYPVVDGVMGQASSDATAILEQIAGEITESELGKELTARIDLIDMNGPGSVNDRLGEVKSDLEEQVIGVATSVASVRNDLTAQTATVSQVKSDLATQVVTLNGAITTTKNSLQTQIDAVNTTANALNYVSSKTYSVGETVRVGQRLYQADKAVPINTTPPNASYWLDVGTIVVSANGLSARVSTTETKITSIEGVNTAQGTSITGLQTALTGKADASAVTSLTTRVTATESKNTSQDSTLTSQGSAITGLTNTVAGKADSTTVASLNNTVTLQGAAITAQGQSITTINANLGEVGSQNLLYNPSFDAPVTDFRAAGWDAGGSAGAVAISLVNSTLDPAGKAQRLDVAGLSSTVYGEVSTELARRPAASEGQVFTSSVYVRGTVGLNAQLYIQALNASNTSIATTTGAFVALTGDWQRVALTSQAFPAGTVKAHIIYRARNGSSVTAGFLEFDRAQAQVGSTMSGWQDSNGTLATDVAANASATIALTGRVTTAENTIVSQGSAITSLNNVVANKADGSAVTALTTRVTATESKNASQDAAIDSQSQSITNLTNTVAGKADSTAVTALTSRVTAAEGVNTTQGASITSLSNTVADKADSAVVSSLTSRVSSAENSITSQGQSITGLTNSLTTTNSNVTAAQAAATNAATLAGSKGKTMVQSATPAAADQLSQNLWIDTTNNANTPKRWTGSAWAAVTDKAATDAAAAAASALAQVETKAEASTVQALSNTVTQQGTAITAQGSAVTDITASLGNIGSQNLLYNPSFDTPGTAFIADGWLAGAGGTGATATPSVVTSTLDPAGKAQRLDVTGLSVNGYAEVVPAAAKRPSASAGQIVTSSAYVRGAAGLNIQLYIQATDAAGVGLYTLTGAYVALTGAWQRVSVTSLALPAGTVKIHVIYRARNGTATAGFIEVDRAQAQLGSVASGWQDNTGVLDSSVTANAAATAGLTARVTQTETGLSSLSSNVTSLTNSIGDIGGDNMLPNSSFEELAAGSTIRPRYWVAGGSVVPTISLVDSPLSLSKKAVRLAKTAVAANGAMELAFNQAEGIARPSVVAGQQYTLSVWARASAGTFRFAMYIQFNNAANSAVISTPTLVETPLTETFQRLTLTGLAPAGAAFAQIYAGRLFNRSGSAADMWLELDNIQFQEGANATGYHPSATLNNDAQVAANSATSSAVDALTSTVTQQGTTLTSVSGRTTALENSVNSASTGLGTKASASAVDTLTNRVTVVEGANTSQSSSITDLNNSVSSIQGVLGASGLDPAPGALWQFDTGSEGWGASGGTLTTGAGFVTITATNADPQLDSGIISIDGRIYSRVRARITRRSGATTDWDGQVLYTTSSHGSSSSYRATAPNPNLAVGQTAVVEWDMAKLLAGGTDWVSNTVTRLRLDLGANSGSSFEIDWIVVGRVAPAASSRALSSLESTVTQQGTDLTAQAQQITGLYTSVGSANSAIQSEATTRANADSAMAKRIDGVQSTAGTASANAQTALNTAADVSGKASAMWSVKLQVDSAGRYYAAGIGLGLDDTGAGLQSSFIVSADRFAIINGLGGSPVSPFAVSNGQTFIADAFIRDASITNAKIGDQLYSSNYVANQSGWILRKDGIFEINSTIPGAGRVLINGNGVNIYDQNGVLRVQLGNLG